MELHVSLAGREELTVEIYRQLRRAILDGRLLPGECLLSTRERWSHGYDLCRSLDLKPGTVYPILIRLAERGLLVTAWEEDPPKGRPARHLYRISPDGAEYARELRLEAAARAAERGAAADPGIAGGAIAGVVL